MKISTIISTAILSVVLCFALIGSAEAQGPTISPTESPTPTFTPIPTAEVDFNKKTETIYGKSIQDPWEVLLYVNRGNTSDYDFLFSVGLQTTYAFFRHDIVLGLEFSKGRADLSFNRNFDSNVYEGLLDYRFKFAGFDALPDWWVPYIYARANGEFIDMDDSTGEKLVKRHGLNLVEGQLGIGSMFLPAPKHRFRLQFGYGYYSGPGHFSGLSRCMLGIEYSYKFSKNKFVYLQANMPFFFAGSEKEDFNFKHYLEPIHSFEDDRKFVDNIGYIGVGIAVKF